MAMKLNRVKAPFPMIRCIFCLMQKPGSEEHVFPIAIGGCLTTNRVCKACNSQLGSRIDAALVDSFMVSHRRSDLGLAGNSGRMPASHEMLLGVAKLASNPEQRVKITFDKTTRKLDVRALHQAADVIIPDGSKARRISIDLRDVGKLPKIIQRERKRHGVPPLSPDQLAAEVKKSCEQSTLIENPSVLMEKSYSFAYVGHAMIKIAYELACVWLGEDYLDDPCAADIRAALCTPDPCSTDLLPAFVMDASECEAFKLWDVGKDHHLAYAWSGLDGIAIAVRVFDIHAAVVWVSKDAMRYLSGNDPHAKLRFLNIDPVSRTMRDATMMDELTRLASSMVAQRRTTLFGPGR